MRALVRESAERNQKRFLKEHKLLLREQELKELSKTSKKCMDEYQKFLAGKDETLKNLYEGEELTNKLKYRKDIEETINNALEDVRESKVDKKRLETYGL